MALVERLMGLESPKIPVHDFFAGNTLVLSGDFTATQVKAFWNLDAAAATEYDAIGATAPSGTAALAMANKAMWAHKLHAVFVLAESGHLTAAQVRTRLGI